jgi:hypothetical protein
VAHQTQTVSWLRIVRVVGIVVVASGLAVASFDTAIGLLIPIALGGGAVVAAALLLSDSRDGHAGLAVDRFGRDRIDIIMNVSRVRVTGIGGAGLVVVAAVVALQYQLLSAVIAAGAVGGGVAALVLIVSRRPGKTAAG